MLTLFCQAEIEFHRDIPSESGRDRKRRNGRARVQRKECWASAEKGMLGKCRERDAGKLQRKGC